MNLKYFLPGTVWYDVISVWCMIIPILALFFTGNFRKSYGTSLAVSLISLFILALRDSRILLVSGISMNMFIKNASIILHSIAVAFFMVHFTDASRRKDQRLVLIMLIVGFILLFVMIGTRDVIFFIVNMACSLVIAIYGIAATRNLFEEFFSNNRAVGGRLLIVASLLAARIGLLGLYAFAYATSPEPKVMARGFETLTLLLSLSLTIGLFRDSGYDPDNMEEDDGPYEALRIDPD